MSTAATPLSGPYNAAVDLLGLETLLAQTPSQFPLGPWSVREEPEGCVEACPACLSRWERVGVRA